MRSSLVNEVRLAAAGAYFSRSTYMGPSTVPHDAQTYSPLSFTMIFVDPQYGHLAQPINTPLRYRVKNAAISPRLPA